MKNAPVSDNRLPHIQAFDASFSLHPLQVCKVLLPLVPYRYQGYLSIFIKYQELLYTISYFQTAPAPCQFFEDPPQLDSLPTLLPILREIRPFVSSDLQKILDQMEQLLKDFDQIKDYLPLLEGMNFSTSSDASSLFGAMMNPTQKEQFNRFEHLFDDM